MTRPDAPVPNLRTWMALSIASVAGASLGDFCSHVLRLGHLAGLPLYAAILAAALAWFCSRTAEAAYWVAIVVVRAAATNLADLATHDLHLPAPAFVAALLAALGLLVATMPHRTARPPADAHYWLAMLLAGTAGTAGGDACADALGLAASTLLWLALWAGAVAAARRRPLVYPLPYWPVVVVVRTMGTNAADLLTGSDGFALGLPVVTGLGLAALAALLRLWPRAPLRLTSVSSPLPPPALPRAGPGSPATAARPASAADTPPSSPAAPPPSTAGAPAPHAPAAPHSTARLARW